MSKMVRIIPRLDVKGPNVVKGIHLEGLRVVGKPEVFAPAYYQEGADELIYIDCVASLYGRNNLEEIIKRAAENIFIPLTVGGGVRSTADIRCLLRAGADKVAINTAAIKTPELIAEGAAAFGSQCIVISIQARKSPEGQYECLTDCGREKTGIDVFEWAEQVVKLGAGEILLTSVDMEGTGRGYDIELVQRVSEMVNIPVIACGGAGNNDHVIQVLQEGQADAASAASIFHYGLIQRIDNDDSWEDGNIDYLMRNRLASGATRKGIAASSIGELKTTLTNAGIECRRV